MIKEHILIMGLHSNQFYMVSLISVKKCFPYIKKELDILKIIIYYIYNLKVFAKD